MPLSITATSQKISCDTDRTYAIPEKKKAILHSTCKYEKWNFHGDKKIKQNRQCQLPAESLPLVSVNYFKLELEVMFFVPKSQNCQDTSEHLLMRGKLHFHL